MMVGDGAIALDADKIRGSVSIDLNTVKADDVDSVTAAFLRRHLLDSPFFDLKHSPLLRLEWQGIRTKPVGLLSDAGYSAKGTLSLRGMPVPVAFPLAVRANGRVLSADGAMKIKWSEDEAPDSMLRPMYLRLHLVGNR